MKKITALLLAAVMLLSGLNVFAEDANAQWQQGEEILNLVRAIRTGGTVVTTVITEPFYEGVTDEKTADAAVESIMDKLGADETTQLMLDAVYSVDDLTYYSYRQIVGDVLVEHASVKLIVDGNGTAICAVGSLKAELDIDIPEDGELTAEQAESIVEPIAAAEDAEIQKGLSHQAVVEFNGMNRLVWVVYSDNPYQEQDVAYLAYYVSDQGEVLNILPIVAPFSTDEENQSDAELVFMGMEPDVWSGEVTLFDGTKRALVVPVMKDEMGAVYLADMQRKIICADYADWEYEKKLNIRVSQDGRFDDGELLIYESIIRVWDFYNEIGWKGADGKGTPIVLKMDMVEQDGEPIQNAAYEGKFNGYQTFAFNRIDRDGETLDIIGHEYTHCVTDSLSVEVPYYNDNGAINEALSDIMGNLMEEMLGASDDPDWLLGEAAKNPEQVLRCMSNPHLFDQPEFLWDRYYYPAPAIPERRNDYGGVHINSSLLNLIAWRLHEAGMTPADEFDYFMNVILTMTGTIAYPDLAVLLPWCLERSKLGEYMDVLTKAIEETGIADYVPVKYAEGCAMVMAPFPAELPFESNNLRLGFIYFDQDGEMHERSTWPDHRLGMILMSLLEGEYIIHLTDRETEREWMLTNDGWIEVTNVSAEEMPSITTVYPIEKGNSYELPGNGITEAETETEDAA